MWARRGASFVLLTSNFCKCKLMDLRQGYLTKEDSVSSVREISGPRRRRMAVHHQIIDYLKARLLVVKWHSFGLFQSLKGFSPI